MRAAIDNTGRYPEIVTMKLSLRGLAALFALLLAAGTLHAQAQADATTSERDKIGYMLGMDVARSLGPGLADIDLEAFRRAVENALAGGKPLLDATEAGQASKQLMDSIAARKNGQPAPAIDRARIGLLLGGNVGRSLTDVRSEFDVAMLLRALQDATTPGAARMLDDAETSRVRAAFSARIASVKQAARQAKAQQATQQEQAFLEQNKQVKGVFTTPSGLQYMVLKQGDGVRPRPGQSVRVHYLGTLLDGTKFDSSYDRGVPAEFRLDQVIRGWTEGVGMMPVGAKYKFWIPSALGYGEQGNGGIPPNSTLVFEVELLGVD
ncbi:MAG: FKBP-type peptidyl-prolyl cis-trans isomerase [Thermomonas sp.]|uniref:FKBP-type peptidyl-prolyl cis-trans isomerase n=1 Tax=Thermomonas sp. TaxID=1971895 RepID=UPI0039E2FEB6